MINRLLGLMARRRLQPLWWGLYRVAIGGLGFMNADSRHNGENRFMRDWAADWAREHPGRAPVVFDVGANEGDFAAAMVTESTDAIVHCFEPNPRTSARLAARFAGNSRVVVNAYGLGDAPGEFTLYDYAGSDGSEHASFLRETFDDVYKSSTQSVTAKVETLDGYLARAGVASVDFLKIDVEGLEKAVLLGAASALREGRIGTIQMEFNAHNLLTGLSVLGLSKMLPGYDLYRLVADGLTPVAGPSHPYNSRVEIFKYANLVAVRDDGAGRG